MNYTLEGGFIYSVETGTFQSRNLYITRGKIADKPEGDSQVINLEEKFVYPGFVDSHAHFVGTGLKELNVNLEKCSSFEDLKNLLSPDRPIVRANGWDQETLGFVPTREIIDKITNRPAILVRRCGHVAAVNTSAVKLFALEQLHGFDGTDTELGIIKERALEELNLRTSLEKAEIDEAINRARTAFLKYGVTSVHSDDYHGVDFYTLMESMSAVDSIKIFEKVAVSTGEQLSLVELAKTYESEYLKVKTAKIYLDGSLGARTAALKKPYSDSPDETGVLYMDLETMKKIVEQADRKDIQLCVHVIGDRSLEVALQAFENSRSRKLKHRLIHVQLASQEQIRKIAELELTASIQPIFYVSDRTIAPARLGVSRMKDAYPFERLKEADVVMALSTDSPVESPSIVPNLIAGDNFFTRQESIYMYSVGGHTLANCGQKAFLLAGEAADLFVSESNLLKASDEMTVWKTFVNGKIVYECERALD